MGPYGPMGPLVSLVSLTPEAGSLTTKAGSLTPKAGVPTPLVPGDIPWCLGINPGAWGYTLVPGVGSLVLTTNFGAVSITPLERAGSALILFSVPIL